MFFIYLWIAVQIILEMLPISSSSHLAVLEALCKKNFSFDIAAFFAHKKVAIKNIYYYAHLPTLIIVMLYFGKQWWHFIFHNSAIDFAPLVWIFIAAGITVIFYWGMQHYKIVFPVRLGLLISACSLFSTAWCLGNKSVELWDYSDAFILGCVQGIALLPGISRLAFTCAAGCWLGFSLLDAFCLSWLIQAPLMGAACLKSCIDMWQMRRLKEVLNLPISLVMLISGGISYALFLFIVYMLKMQIFYLWGWYMILLFLIWGWLKD